MKKIHFAAWFAMFRYTLYATVTTFSAWLTQAGPDKWNSMTSYDRWQLTTELTLSALAAVGAVMNGRWTEAKNAAINSK